MDISGVSSTASAQSTTVAIEVQKKSQDIQQQTAETLVESVADPDASLGQNIDVKA